MKLSPRRRRVWRCLIRKLKGELPPGVPVTVRTQKLKDISGDSDRVMKLGRMVGIRIRISDDPCWSCRVDTLIHEWAHAMEWSAHWVDGSPKQDHGETWGVWYAKAYCLLSQIEE